MGDRIDHAALTWQSAIRPGLYNRVKSSTEKAGGSKQQSARNKTGAQRASRRRRSHRQLVEQTAEEARKQPEQEPTVAEGRQKSAAE